MRKMLTVASFLIAGLFLSGCQKSNPLINDQTIAYMKTRISTQGFLGEPIITCGNIYAGYAPSTEALTAKCDKWSKREFQSLQEEPSTSYKTTMEDFKDPKFWQLLLPHSK